MAIIGKCRSASPYNNCAATVEVSKLHYKTYTYPGYQSSVDPTGYSNRMTNRLNAVNYYYGTSNTSTGSVTNGLRWQPY